MDRLKIVFPRYAGEQIDSSLQFSQNELDALSKIIENKIVIVGDLHGTNHTLPLLVYLFPKNLGLEWSPAAWHALLAYRNWPAPKTDSHAHFLIVAQDKSLPNGCQLKFKTRQYQLLDCQKLPQSF